MIVRIISPITFQEVQKGEIVGTVQIEADEVITLMERKNPLPHHVGGSSTWLVMPEKEGVVGMDSQTFRIDHSGDYIVQHQ